MAISTATSVSLSQIQTEFGGSNPISISEYYAGAGLVPSGTIGYPTDAPGATGPHQQIAIPSSGAISFANFFGSSNIFEYVAFASQTSTLSINVTSMTNAGWNGSSKIRVKINSGVFIRGATSTAAAMFITGDFPGGIEVLNYGTLAGRGGTGGNGGIINGTTAAYTSATNGSAGGTAISISSYTGPIIQILNYGYIRGGGGGGGGGRPRRYTFTDSSDPPQTFTVAMGGGGGGGGQQAYGTSFGGNAGTTSSASYLRNGTAGGSGSSTSSGTGGSGGVYTAGSIYGGSGGNGGSYGSQGNAGLSGLGGTAYGLSTSGGSAGRAITGYANASLTNYEGGAYSGSLIN